MVHIWSFCSQCTYVPTVSPWSPWMYIICIIIISNIYFKEIKQSCNLVKGIAKLCSITSYFKYNNQIFQNMLQKVYMDFKIYTCTGYHPSRSDPYFKVLRLKQFRPKNQKWSKMQLSINQVFAKTSVTGYLVLHKIYILLVFVIFLHTL